MKHKCSNLLLGLSLWLLLSAAQAHEFSFARLMYSQGFDGDWQRWRADWPDAEHHFSHGLNRLTRVDVAPDGILLRINDESLFDFPWLYVVEVGYWQLSSQEQINLREYLLRGGFLMVDDFHGIHEWRNFETIMRRVFPDRQIVDLDNGAEAFHVLYDLAKREQIPGIRALMNDRTYEKGGFTPRWRGLLDDEQRVMVAINFNQDIGDAWEHADDARYPANLTAQAYRLGVNYVLYAMTH